MSSPTVSREGADWRRAVGPYLGPDARRASLQLVTTLVPLALIVCLIYAVMPHSMIAALLLAIPAAGLIIRTFIFMHDCAHGSFFPSRVVNDTVGFVTGVLTLTPYAQWRRDHAIHHATSGDLDRRGHGDVPTLTVREYMEKSRWDRLMYRFSRHPVLLLIGGPFYLGITQRFRSPGAASGARQTFSVWSTNIALVLVLAVAIFLLGWKSVLVAYLVPYYIAAMAGVWLFYVQHQFEDAYWESHDDWDYVTAALQGSSHLRLSPVLRWFTGSIGLHHVHHVAPRIPNYRLQRCHDENELFQRSPVVTLSSGMAALRLALWDEDRRRLVRFSDITVQ